MSCNHNTAVGSDARGCKDCRIDELEDELHGARGACDHMRRILKEADTVQVSREDLRLLLSFAPKGCPEGLDPTFYHTLTYKGDKKIQDRIDALALLAQEKDE